jgi:hypothetical protein
VSEDRHWDHRVSKDLEGLLDRHYVEEDVVTTHYELPPPVADPPAGEGTPGSGGQAGHAE